MVRKIFSALLMLSVMLAGSVALADYQKYLGGDRNYILFDGIQGVGRYVYAPSLSVDEYNPPRYVISIDWVSVDDAYRGKTQISARDRVRFGYDWDARKIYFVNDGGEWKMIDPEGSRASGSAFAGAAEIAFALAYNLKFLGIYSEDFYDFMR